MLRMIIFEILIINDLFQRVRPMGDMVSFIQQSLRESCSKLKVKPALYKGIKQGDGLAPLIKIDGVVDAVVICVGPRGLADTYNYIVILYTNTHLITMDLANLHSKPASHCVWNISQQSSPISSAVFCQSGVFFLLL